MFCTIPELSIYTWHTYRRPPEKEGKCLKRIFRATNKCRIKSPSFSKKRRIQRNSQQKLRIYPEKPFCTHATPSDALTVNSEEVSSKRNYPTACSTHAVIKIVNRSLCTPYITCPCHSSPDMCTSLPHRGWECMRLRIGRRLATRDVDSLTAFIVRSL